MDRRLRGRRLDIVTAGVVIVLGLVAIAVNLLTVPAPSGLEVAASGSTYHRPAINDEGEPGCGPSMDCGSAGLATIQFNVPSSFTIAGTLNSTGPFVLIAASGGAATEIYCEVDSPFAPCVPVLGGTSSAFTPAGYEFDLGAAISCKGSDQDRVFLPGDWTLLLLNYSPTAGLVTVGQAFDTSPVD
jgi:hypothetical protein